MGRFILILGLILSAATRGGEPARPSPLEVVLAETKPLATPRGTRLPLYLFTPDFPKTADDAALETTIKDLDARGISLLARWGDPKTVDACLKIAAIQKKLGIPVSVDGTGLVHGFYNGKPEVAHKGEDGKALFDKSFFWSPGCPFAIHTRYEFIKSRFTPFIEKYKAAGVPVEFFTADFEFDGPIEWNDGWAVAKKCSVCKEKIKDIDSNFSAFQSAVRAIRTEMQRECFSTPMKAAFPEIKIGVYGMNPHDGFRYWWDFFEKQDEITGATSVYKKDGKALYRAWPKEFDASGYNVAQPVIYSLYNPYGFEPNDYGFFYNMLLEATSVAKHTPESMPLVPFVFWAYEMPDKKPGMSEEKYEEILWHMLLRGADGFIMWSPPEQTAKAIRPIHKVYGAALEHKEFLDKGKPVAFDCPSKPGPVVSALKLDDRLLVRRTDFDGNAEPVLLKFDGNEIKVPRADGKCVVISLKQGG